MNIKIYFSYFNFPSPLFCIHFWMCRKSYERSFIFCATVWSSEKTGRLAWLSKPDARILWGYNWHTYCGAIALSSPTLLPFQTSVCWRKRLFKIRLSFPVPTYRSIFEIETLFCFCALRLTNFVLFTFWKSADAKANTVYYVAVFCCCFDYAIARVK